LSVEIALKLNPEQADIDPIDRGLIDFNRRASGRDAGYQPFALHLVDPITRAPVGGLSGWASFDWLFIELLHVPEELRGQGQGRALMERAEALARELRLVGIWLDTFDFQARGFYEKLGFTVFGTIEDHPIGGRRYLLQKRLAAKAEGKG
jgi:GNAT superfamily N-acetyltransferase